MNLFLDSFFSHCKFNIEPIKKMMRNIICNLLLSFLPTETSHIHNKKRKWIKEIFDFFRSYQKEKNKQCGRRDIKYNATWVFVWMKNKRKLERIAMYEMAMFEFFVRSFVYWLLYLQLRNQVEFLIVTTKQNRRNQIICRRKIEKKRKATDYRNRNSNLCINNKNSFTILDFNQATIRTQYEWTKINCFK